MRGHRQYRLYRRSQKQGPFKGQTKWIMEAKLNYYARAFLFIGFSVKVGFSVHNTWPCFSIKWQTTANLSIVARAQYKISKESTSKSWRTTIKAEFSCPPDASRGGQMKSCKSRQACNGHSCSYARLSFYQLKYRGRGGRNQLQSCSCINPRRPRANIPFPYKRAAKEDLVSCARV